MSKQYQRLSNVIAKSLDLTVSELQAGFRLARSDEISDVSKMRRLVFGEESIKDDDQVYLKWRYFGREGYGSTLWVYELSGKVIGAMGTEPVVVQSNEDVIPAVRSMDAIIHPDFDNRGLGAWMVLALQNNYDCILVSGGNENSTSMLKKLFTPLPVRKNFKLLLKSNTFLADKLPYTLALVLSPVTNIGLNLFLALKWLRTPKINNLKIRNLSDIEALINALPDGLSRLGDVKVIRDKAYLRWRYQQNPRTNFKVSAAYEEGILVAYIIFSYSGDEASSDMPRGRIVDWAAYGSHNASDALSILLKFTAKQLKSLGAEQVFMVLNDADSAHAATSVGFSLRNIDARFFVYHKTLALDAPLFSDSLWFQSMSDSDGV